MYVFKYLAIIDECYGYNLKNNKFNIVLTMYDFKYFNSNFIQMMCGILF